MTELPVIPENAPFNLEQRLWLNGFLAGYFSRLSLQAQIAGDSASLSPRIPLLILFGSQTGTAEALAKRIGKEAASRGFNSRVLDASKHATIDWKTEATLFVVTSTYGDGDMPDNAQLFWNWLQTDEANVLAHLKFSVLALGDTSYAEFCAAGKKIDARLGQIGARRIFPQANCDLDYEAAAKAWTGAALTAASKTMSNTENSANPPPVHSNGSSNGDTTHVLERSPSGFSKTNPFPAPLLKNVSLTKPGSSKEVRHYELSIQGSGLSYEAGDALGVVPVNCPEAVGDLLAALRCTGEESISVNGTTLSLRGALTRHFDLTKPTNELLAAIAQRSTSDELDSLLKRERSADLKRWLWGRGIVDLLLLMSESFSAGDFVNLLRKLTPRLYSISSSPKAHPGEVHLTVSAVRYQAHGRARKGVASTFLADRVGDDDRVKIFVQPARGFKPPTDNDSPAIMVGPGTGVAPFRAFLEDREAAGARGKNWLFFGDQKQATDFLYEDQLVSWHKDGHLTRLDLAFSRDQKEKCYVQHRMLESAPELWSWLQGGAHFYVCGDASRMAKDVDAALHAVAQRAGGLSCDAAVEFVKTLRDEKRYQRDVY